MNGYPTIDHWSCADDLRNIWQGRLMRAVKWECTIGHVKPKDKMAACVLSVLAHSYPYSAMFALMVVLFPGFVSILPPFFITCGKISRQGKVYADMTTKETDGVVRVIVFQTEQEMVGEFRKLADELKLNDRDRTEMFAAVKRWIVCDYQIDPNTGQREAA